MIARRILIDPMRWHRIVAMVVRLVHESKNIDFY